MKTGNIVTDGLKAVQQAVVTDFATGERVCFTGNAMPQQREHSEVPEQEVSIVTQSTNIFAEAVALSRRGYEETEAN